MAGGRKKAKESEKSTSMAGSSKVGKRLEKCESKRHVKILRDTIHGISKPDIARVARRAGVKRISKPMYEMVRGYLKQFVQEPVRDTVIVAEHVRNEETVVASDVVYANKKGLNKTKAK